MGKLRTTESQQGAVDLTEMALEYLGAGYLHLSGTFRSLQSAHGNSLSHFCFRRWHSMHESKRRFLFLDDPLVFVPLIQRQFKVNRSVFE